MLMRRLMTGDPGFGPMITRKGGGGSSVSKQEIDPDIKRRVLPVLDQAGAEYRAQIAGDKPIVAGLNQQQEAGLQAQEGLAQQAIDGTGLYNTEAELNRALAQAGGMSDHAASAGGSLGSARSQAARESALANVALDDLNQRRAIAGQGVQAMRDAGDVRQQDTQQQLDKEHTAASRYFGYLQSAPQGSTATSSQGGGK